MNIRRMSAVIAAVAAIALVPTFGQAVAEESSVPGTNCAVGHETLAYNASASAVRFEFGSSVACTEAYPVIILTTSLRGVTNPTVHTEKWGCPNCSEVATPAPQGDPAAPPQNPIYRLDTGVYAITSVAEITNADRSVSRKGKHTTCFMIVDFTVQALTGGCPVESNQVPRVPVPTPAPAP